MEEWLSDEALQALDFKGENMKTFALILFFGCAGLLIISATVQILYAVFWGKPMRFNSFDLS